MDAISVTQVSKRYGSNVQALDGVDLTIHQGDFFGLLGPNGAGKSTLIGVLSTLIVADQGRLSVLGSDLRAAANQVKACLGVVPQEINLNGFETVLQILVQAAGYYGVPRQAARQRAEDLLRLFELWEKRHQQTRTLSGGMRRRVMIVRALMHKPRILILDEPTAGVDVDLRRTTWAILKQLNAEGMTILLTTHYLEEAEALCNRLAIIHQGRIAAAGQTADLLRSLGQETWRLTLAAAQSTAPQLADYSVRGVDELTLEVDLTPQQNVSDLLIALDQSGTKVHRLAPAANPLESLFVSLTQPVSR